MHNDLYFEILCPLPVLKVEVSNRYFTLSDLYFEILHLCEGGESV